MTDRLARICGTALSALGLLLGVPGCGQESHTATAPPTIAPPAAPSEPPRLLREMTADPPMDSPLVLDGGSEHTPTRYSRGGLNTPPADRGYNGDEISVAETPLAATKPVGDNLLLPPTDRKSGVVGEDEAPLPELVPFDTPEALAAHASNEASDESGSPTTTEAIAESQPTGDDLARHSSEQPDETVKPVTDSGEPAATDAPNAIAAADVPREKPIDQGPLPSTGALAISKVESISPTDRKAGRISLSTDDTPRTTPESPVPSAIASQDVPVSSPSPAASVPKHDEPTEVATESLAISPPPAQQDAPAIAPSVAPLQPKASDGDAATAQKSERTPDAMVSSVRPSAPLVVATPPTTTTPPTRVAQQPAPTGTGRAPLPATELPPQAPIVASPLPAEPSDPSVVAQRATTLSPTAIVALEQHPTAVDPRPPVVAKQPVTRRPLGQPLSEQMVNRPPVEQRLPAATATPPRPAVVPPPSSVANKRPQVKPVPDRAESQPTATSNLASKNTAGQPSPVRPAPQPTRIAADNPAQPPSQPATQAFAARDRALPPAPGIATPMRSSELMAVARMADEHTRQAFHLANRGALYSARDEFIEALQMVSHAIDAEQRSYEHSQALSDGLTAIRESDDFTSRGGRSQDNVDVVTIARSHNTPVLKGLEPKSVSRMAAMQQYYTYAQRRLAFAVSGEPSGSVALYGLGKLYTVLAQLPPQGIVAPEPKAIVFHQAALLVDGRNYMAANDLGVLLARYGKYQQAKSALLHSLSIAPQQAAWHNLTVVHQHLGEVKLAQLAQAESQAAKARAKQIARASGQSKTDTTTVVWLDPVTFSKSSEMWSDPAKPKNENSTQTTASKPPVAPPADSPKKGWFRK